MALVTTAGTETLHAHHFEDLSSATTQNLIVGVQHHIYTVLSIIIRPTVLNATTDKITITILGYNSTGGTTNVDMPLFSSAIPVNTTFVFNDKFSFNGFEPVNFTGPMNDATKQDAIADQGSGVTQYLRAYGDHSADRFKIHVTYIDQNNA